MTNDELVATTKQLLDVFVVGTLDRLGTRRDNDWFMNVNTGSRNERAGISAPEVLVKVLPQIVQAVSYIMWQQCAQEQRTTFPTSLGELIEARA